MSLFHKIHISDDDKQTIEEVGRKLLAAAADGITIGDLGVLISSVFTIGQILFRHHRAATETPSA